MAVGILRKRAYEPAGRADGYYLLVDRIRPRGLFRKDAGIEWVSRTGWRRTAR